MDFALTGTINKFTVSKARGGGLSDHIWWIGEGRAAEHHVSVGFVDEAGSRFVVTRTRDGSANTPLGEAIARLSSSVGKADSSLDALMQTTLIRDELISALSLDLPEQARFAAVRSAIGAIAGPDHAERTNAVLSEARVSLTTEQTRSRGIQDEIGRGLGRLTDARTEAGRSSDLAEALRLIDATVPEVAGRPRAESARAYLADRKSALARLTLARANASAIAQEAAFLASDAYRDARADAEAVLQRAEAAVAATLQKLALAERLIEAEKLADVYAAHLAALVEHGTALGTEQEHCPLCDAVRSDAEFAAAIARTRARLVGRGDRLAVALENGRSARAELVQEESIRTEAAAALEKLVKRTSSLEASRSALHEMYQAAGFEFGVEDLETAERVAGEEQQRLVALERALLILGASEAAERITIMEGRLAELRNQAEDAAGKVADAERVVEVARQIDSAARTVSNEILMEQFDTVMPLLKELYRRLRPHADWTEIDSDFGGKVRGSLNFTVGTGHNPQFLFSSGQRRAAGLAFLLAVHLSRPWCRWRSLLLDDPVQHIDDYRALNLVEVLASIRQSGRQVIVAVEDAALADVLCRRLRSTATEPGRRIDLGRSSDGTVGVEATMDVAPMPRCALRKAAAS